MALVWAWRAAHESFISWSENGISPRDATGSDGRRRSRLAAVCPSRPSVASSKPCCSWLPTSMPTPSTAASWK
eukprot:3207849-Prymnesium_polylepis.1